MGFGSASNLDVQAVRKAAMPDLCHVHSWSQASVNNTALFVWGFSLFVCFFVLGLLVFFLFLIQAEVRMLQSISTPQGPIYT